MQRLILRRGNRGLERWDDAPTVELRDLTEGSTLAPFHRGTLPSFLTIPIAIWNKNYQLHASTVQLCQLQTVEAHSNFKWSC